MVTFTMPLEISPALNRLRQRLESYITPSYISAITYVPCIEKVRACVSQSSPLKSWRSWQPSFLAILALGHKLDSGPDRRYHDDA